MNDEMTEHERAAIEAAIDKLMPETGNSYSQDLCLMWNAARAYVSPTNEAEKRCAYLHPVPGYSERVPGGFPCRLTRTEHTPDVDKIEGHAFRSRSSEAR